MKKLNWNGYCHVIYDLPFPFIDMHFHGLDKEIGTELQYVLDVGSEYLSERQELIYDCATEIFNGILSIDSDKPFTLKDFGWGDCKFKFFKTKDSNDKPIIRIIECDMTGKFPENKNCDPYFAKQYDDIYKDKNFLKFC